MSKPFYSLLVLAAGLLLANAQDTSSPASTENSTTSQQQPQPTPRRMVGGRPVGKEEQNERYQLFQGRYTPTPGPGEAVMRGTLLPVDAIFKIDTMTGRVWRLNKTSDGFSWLEVKEHE
jgi:hypothetical protein